jgi:hypothetical protein
MRAGAEAEEEEEEEERAIPRCNEHGSLFI